MKFNGLSNFRCWWFGCQTHPQAQYNTDIIACERCGGWIDYADLVGDTRHNRFKEWVNYWGYRKWWPKKCSDCGGRWKHDETIDHIPF